MTLSVTWGWKNHFVLLLRHDTLLSTFFREIGDGRTLILYDSKKWNFLFSEYLKSFWYMHKSKSKSFTLYAYRYFLFYASFTTFHNIYTIFFWTLPVGKGKMFVDNLFIFPLCVWFENCFSHSRNATRINLPFARLSSNSLLVSFSMAIFNAAHRHKLLFFAWIKMNLVEKFLSRGTTKKTQ